jgi:hypothetical protein
MTDEQMKAVAALKMQSDNIASQLQAITDGTRLSTPVLSLPANQATEVTPINPAQPFTVNPWFALVLAALIPVTAAVATQLTGVAAIVATAVGAALTGVAAFLGMKVGSPKA